MNELWESGASGRIIANVIYAVSFLVAAYLLFIAYKHVMRLMAGRKVKEITVKYAKLFDLNPPYAKGEVQFGIELPESMKIKFQIIDKNDDSMFILLEGIYDKGIHPVLFDTKELKDGEYYYQLITDLQKNTKKFFIVNNH